MNSIANMNRAADNIRLLAASMVEKAKSGHPGGAMGGADFINVLFSEYLVYDPENPFWDGRDRFFLDPGHMSSMLYSVLSFTGKFTMEELASFRQWGSPTPGHPERCVERGIENTSGPLGQGHTFAVDYHIRRRTGFERHQKFVLLVCHAEWCHRDAFDAPSLAVGDYHAVDPEIFLGIFIERTRFFDGFDRRNVNAQMRRRQGID